MNIQEAIKVMHQGSYNEKMEYLNFLYITFDTYNRNIEHADAVINVLIDCALASKEDKLLDEILEVICSAQVSQNLQNINYDRIAVSLNDLPIKYLPKYIEILGNTYDKRYVASILQFKNHCNKYVNEAVSDALVELQVTDL